MLEYRHGILTQFTYRSLDSKHPSWLYREYRFRMVVYLAFPFRMLHWHRDPIYWVYAVPWELLRFDCRLSLPRSRGKLVADRYSKTPMIGNYCRSSETRKSITFIAVTFSDMKSWLVLPENRKMERRNLLRQGPAL